MADAGFVPLPRDDEYEWYMLPDGHPVKDQINGRTNDAFIWGKTYRMTLRCFNCGRKSRSIYPIMDCVCGYRKIYVTRYIRRAAEALFSAGFDVRAAIDIVAIEDGTDVTMFLLHIDFFKTYSEKVFFGFTEHALPDDWNLVNLVDEHGSRFTRLYNNGDLLPLDESQKAVQEIKRLSAELEAWAKDFKDSGAYAVMLFAGLM